MRSGTNRQNRRHLVRATSVAALCTLAVAGQALGEPAAAPSPLLPTVVVTGGFSCQNQIYPLYPISGPAPDPIEYATRMLVSIGFSATAGVVPASAPLPGVSPGFGGRGFFGGPPVSLTPAPISGGAGVSSSFDGGTLDDCRGFAETVRAAARRLGCTVSRVNLNNPLPLYGGGAQVGLVCEAPVDQAIHAIAELDRVVLALQPEPGE
jgi:hypothetical protein